MPDWYWEKKELHKTPSQEKGMDFDTETKCRQEGVRFLMEMGKALNLSHNTMATGSVYFHRFYMFHSFQDFPKLPVATCCLFLAGKCEETPKKCRDIIRTIRQLTTDSQFETFGVDPDEEIMALERVLLQTIHFDLQVDHPYAFIIKYAKTLKGEKNKIQKVVQMAWTFVNDSLCTTLCLVWEPEIVAIAVMYLAAKLSKFEVKDWSNRIPTHVNWWDQFAEDLETSDLEEICHQVLDLYNPPQLANLATPASQTNGKATASKTTSKTTPPQTPARAVSSRPQPQTPPSRPRARTPPMPPGPSATTPTQKRSRASTPPLPPINGAVRPPPPPVMAAAPPLPPLGPTGYPPGPPPPPAAAYYYPPNFPPQIGHPHFVPPPQPYTYPVPPGQVFYPAGPPPHPPPPEGFSQPPPNYHGNLRY